MKTTKSSITKISLIILILAFSCSAVSTYYSNYNDYLQFHWASAVKSTSIILKVFPFLTQLGSLNTFIVVYTKTPGLPVTVKLSLPVAFVSETYPVKEVTISGLTPNTQYYYTFIFTQDATIDSAAFVTYYSSNTVEDFQFRTFDVALKPYNFTFGAASCARTGSTSTVFNNLRNESFDFFIHMGDLHYSDIAVNDVDRFYNAYYRVFNSSTQRQFFQNTPVYYVFDDHDFGINDAQGTSLSKPAVTTAFKRFAPYSPLKNTLPDDETGVTPNMNAYLSYTADPDYGIFRSWVVGRCLFIMFDLRSFKDVLPGDMLGDSQRTWIENQIRFAGLTANIKLVIFISSIPWIDINPGSEWEDFEITQEWIGNLVKQHIYNNNKDAILLAGDAHMIALDNGTNNQYGGFPVIQAAALDMPASRKGGPYSHGMFPDINQYARLEVVDPIYFNPCVNIHLKKLGETRIAYSTCTPHLYPPAAVEGAWINTYPGAPYIVGFGSLTALLIVAGTIFFCRQRRLRKRALAQKKREEEYAKTKLQDEGQEMGKDTPAQSSLKITPEMSA